MIVATFVEQLNRTNESNGTRKEAINHSKARLVEFVKKKWESKVRHGKNIRSTGEQLVRGEDTFLWLLRGKI
jgi:hypothetical protein